MQIPEISETETTLSELIKKVMNGEEIIIEQAGKPVAKLIPYVPDTSPRELGVGNWQGKIWIADDFNELHDEIWNQFTGEEVDEYY